MTNERREKLMALLLAALQLATVFQTGQPAVHARAALYEQDAGADCRK